MNSKFLLLLISILITTGTYSQEITYRKEKKKLEYGKLQELLNSGEYKFVANIAIAKGGMSFDLTTNPNHLIIKADSAKAHLPFFGERYIVVNLGEYGGIEFESRCIDYSLMNNDKKLIVNIHFKVKSRDDLYDCFLTVSSGGNGTLSISSNNRSYITYYGETYPLNE